MAENEQPDVMSLTVTLLTAYFANNAVPSGELPTLVDGTRKALLGHLTAPSSEAAPVAAPPATAVVETPDTMLVEDAAPVTEPVPAVEPAAAETSPAAEPKPQYLPAVSIEESLASPDHLLSLVDGKPYKTLKRHLASHRLTPAEYRARYTLPDDYPMTAPSYSEARRAVARANGLGGRRPAIEAPIPVVDEAETMAAAAPTETPEPKAPASRRKTAKASAPTKKAAAKPASKPRSKKGAATMGPAAATEAEPAPEPATDAATPPKRRRTKAATAAAAETVPAPEPVAESVPTPKRRRAKATMNAEAPVPVATPEA